MHKLILTVAFLCAGALALADATLVHIRETTAEVGFSPNGQALDVVLDAIGDARSEILVAAYGFSNKAIANALLDAQRRGVKIKVVADKTENTEKYSVTGTLARAGIPVRLYSATKVMHNKYLVVDRLAIVTGSLNFTQRAPIDNAENAILLPAKDLAQLYAANWEKLWAVSNDLR